MATASRSRGIRRSTQSTQSTRSYAERFDGRDFKSLRQYLAENSACSACSALIVVVVIAFVTSGCRRDMHDQPKYIPLRASSFYPDDRSARPLVEGTVARGHLHADTLLETGKVGDEDATVFPFAVDLRVLERGRE